MGKSNFSFGISQAALDDTNEISLWYDVKMQGLGYRFLSKLKDAFDKIQSSPEAFGQYKGKNDIRKYSVTGFPYKIYYLFRKNHIEILAIVHMSRSNQFIKRKLR
jgi:plasmid stabilization system protein ParE